MSEILVCDHLSKDYGSVAALNDFNLTLESGRIVGLLGPNGSGKNNIDQNCQRTARPDPGKNNAGWI